MSRQSAARQRVTAAILGAGVAFAFAACGDKKKTEASSETPTAVPPADAALPPSPGLVYFAVSREGVVQLSGGVFKRVLTSQGRIDDLAIGRDGDVFAIADAQILTTASDGESAEVIGNRSAPGVARRIAAASDGSLWAITGKGLWVRSAGEWKMDETFPRPRTVADIVATRGGRVVAAARDAAFIAEPGGWREVELPEPPPEPKVPKAAAGGSAEDGVGGDEDGADEEGTSKKRGTYLRSLALGADDRVYASTSSGVYVLGDAEWKLVTDRTVTAFAVAADGTLAASGESGNLLIGNGGGLREKEIASLGIAASELDAIATDSHSRLWVATDGGWVIANDRGEALAVHSAGSQAELPGRIVAIRVIDAPTILPEIRERRIGAVAGTLVGLDKKSVAGVEVEVCARPDTLFRGSPCAEAAVRGAAVTNDSGAFQIDGVAAGRYGFAIKRDGEWVVDLTIDCCTQLFSSETVKLKKLRLGD